MLSPKLHVGHFVISMMGVVSYYSTFGRSLGDIIDGPVAFIARVLQLNGAAMLVLGTLGVVRGKVWGVLLGGSSTVLLIIGAQYSIHSTTLPDIHPAVAYAPSFLGWPLGYLAAGLAALAAVPFAAPVWRALRGA